MGILYRIFNLNNNKSYIGKTYNTLEDRLAEHIKASVKFSNRPLYKAFNLEGLEVFSAEILGEYEPGILELEEQKAILSLESFKEDKGYNATLGGEGRKTLTISDEEILLEYLNNSNIAELSRKLNIDRKSIKQVLLANNIGIKSSGDIIRDKISPKILIEETGDTFDNVYECIKFLQDCDIVTCKPKTASNCILRVCKGERHSYMGIKFSFA